MGKKITFSCQQNFSLLQLLPSSWNRKYQWRMAVLIRCSFRIRDQKASCSFRNSLLAHLHHSQICFGLHKRESKNQTEKIDIIWSDLSSSRNYLQLPKLAPPCNIILCGHPRNKRIRNIPSFPGSSDIVQTSTDRSAIINNCSNDDTFGGSNGRPNRILDAAHILEGIFPDFIDQQFSFVGQFKVCFITV